MTPYRVTARDRLAHWLADRALHIATPEYRALELDRQHGIERPRKEE